MIKITNIKNIKSLFEDNTKTIKTSNPWWLICITSGAGFPIFKTEQMAKLNCLGVLPVAMDDFIPTSIYWKDKDAWKKTIEFTYRMPHKSHAEDIIRFLDGIKTNERLIVNCEAGISRSAAVAYFAAQYVYGKTPDELFDRDIYSPNPLIGALLRDAAGFHDLEDSWKLLECGPRKPDPWGDETK